MSKLNRVLSSLGLFCHVPWKRDLLDWDSRMRSSATPFAVGCTYTQMRAIILCIAIEVALNLILKSQSNRSIFNGTWQKGPRELDNRLSPPAPMNHVKIFKGWPLQDAPSMLVQLWYKSFPPGRFLPGGNEEANYVE